MEQLLLTVPEAAKVLNVSRSLVYELIYRGQLESVKLGGRRRIPVSAVRALARAESDLVS